MQALLSDPLPLRRTLEMPQYRVDAVIPWLYGRVTIEPIPLDDKGLLWLLADHALQAIQKVTAGGADVTGFELYHEVDPTGIVQAKMRLTQPPKDGKALAVTVLAKRNTDTGELITHPADVVRDLLTQCGWTLTPDAFDGLRDDYPGVEVGGIINEAKPLREAIKDVLNSIGAIWSGEPLRARAAWSQPAPVDIITQYNTTTAEATASASELANTLRISYAKDHAANRPAQALTLVAPSSVDDIGSIPQDMELPWLRTARDALALGTAILQDLARPAWKISLSADDTGQRWQPGDRITINHPLLPTGVATITSIDRDPDAVTLSATLSMPAGTAPRVEIAARSKAIDVAIEQTVYVLRDGKVDVYLRDDAGAVMAFVLATVDDIQNRSSDKDGKVTFTGLQPGWHTVTVTAFGYDDQSMEIFVNG